MKKLTLGVIGVFICASLVYAGAQRGVTKKQSFTGKLPDQVCSAIEQYIANVDAARSLKDSAARKAQYAAAKDDLSQVLKRNGRIALLNEITPYAQYAEMATAADSRDPNLTQILTDRLKTRTKLLQWCTTDSPGR